MRVSYASMPHVDWRFVCHLAAGWFSRSRGELVPGQTIYAQANIPDLDGFLITAVVFPAALLLDRGRRRGGPGL